MTERKLPRAGRPLALLAGPRVSRAALLAPAATLALGLAAALGSAPTLADTTAPSATPPSATAPSATAFRVGALCAAPSPGHSGCLALRLVPDQPLAVAGARVVPQASSGPHAALPSVASDSTAPLGSAGEPPLAGEASESGDGGEAREGAGETKPASEPVPAGVAVEHRTPIAGSLSPASILTAYGLNGATPPSTQTIALVDAYDDATIASDLAVFDSRFGLPACTEANGCFRKVNESGNTLPLPASSGRDERGWAQEIATDVEVAHGVCASCKILLVEASSNENSDLYTAEQTAATLGANEISNSWGGEEPSSDSRAFNHPGVAITASAGDEGYLDWLTGERAAAAQYPASSPHVVGVGGTRLALNAETSAWEGETVWNDGGSSGGALEGSGAGGGGCSARFAAPSWQQALPDWSAVGCGSTRSVADVAADADPYTGVAVYDSTETPEGEKGWETIGGTSVASPIVASAFALAGGARGVPYPSRTLYENLASDPASLHDVVTGSNGECLKRPNKKTGASSCAPAEEAALSCAGKATCLAGPGYDGPTGVGTPHGIDAFLPLAEHTSEGALTPAEEGAPVQTAPGTSTPGSSAPPASASGTPPADAGATTVTPAIGALALTRGARAAATRRRAKLSKLAFTFKLNIAARVRVTFTELVRVHGRLRWRTVTAPPAFLARAGTQTRALVGRARLASGRYRLTLAPAGGVARTLTFSVR